jgi:hypothetical protein
MYVELVLWHDLYILGALTVAQGRFLTNKPEYELLYPGMELPNRVQNLLETDLRGS